MSAVVSLATTWTFAANDSARAEDSVRAEDPVRAELPDAQGLRTYTSGDVITGQFKSGSVSIDIETGIEGQAVETVYTVGPAESAPSWTSTAG